jgi:Transcriptional regulator/sugar kinase
MGKEDYVLGIDIGGTHVRLGLVNREYELKNFTQKNTKEIFRGASPVKKLANEIRKYLREFASGETVVAVSIGFPSTIDKDRKVVLSTPNIAPLQDLSIVELMKTELDIPVYINRDVNFLILYDMQAHKVGRDGVVVGCYVGTGLGNAICIDGELLTGKNGVAAELGHIPVLGSGEVCTCGNEGCMEIYASGRYLEKLVRQHFPDTAIGEIFSRHNGDPLVRQFIDYLGVAIAIEVNIMDPDYIIIGGGVPQMPDFPKAYLEECIRRRSRKPFPAGNLQIVYSRDAQENGVIGAGIYTFMKLGEA